MSDRTAAQSLEFQNESRERRDILAARDALRRVQTGRIWFEPYSDCLNPLVEAIKALDRLAGYDEMRLP